MISELIAWVSKTFHVSTEQAGMVLLCVAAILVVAFLLNIGGDK